MRRPLAPLRSSFIVIYTHNTRITGLRQRFPLEVSPYQWKGINAKTASEYGSGSRCGGGGRDRFGHASDLSRVAKADLGPYVPHVRACRPTEELYCILRMQANWP